jgi:hypothetical protein
MLQQKMASARVVRDLFIKKQLFNVCLKIFAKVLANVKITIVQKQKIDKKMNFTKSK